MQVLIGTNNCNHLGMVELLRDRWFCSNYLSVDLGYFYIVDLFDVAWLEYCFLLRVVRVLVLTMSRGG